MNEPPVAGTFRLDGMLQGPLPPGHEAAADLHAWTASAKAGGLHFHLGFDGGTWSLVADPTVQKTSRLKDKNLEALLTDGLNALLDLLPPPSRASAFSTIRSEEFRPGTAVQTLYAVGPDGRISSEQRSIDADTGEPPPEITPASLRRAALPTLAAVLLLLFISSFFINYRQLFSSARERLVPLDKAELSVVHELTGDSLTFELVEVDNKNKSLVFRLARGPGWERAMTSAPERQSAATWPEFTTLLALHLGRLRIDLLNKEKHILLSREIDITPLREKDSLVVTVPARHKDRIARAILRP